MTESLIKSSIELPPSEAFLPPASEFVVRYARGLGMTENRIDRLRDATENAIALVMRNNQRGHSDARVGVDVFEDHGKVMVEVLNRGVPLFFDQEVSFKGSTELDRFSVENLGRQGQTVVLGMRLGESAVKTAIDANVADALFTEEDLADVTIRRMEVGEEKALSELFYFVYGYSYINDFVYYPEKIRKQLEEGKLISIVAALPNGKLLGHVGLMKWNDHPAVYEPCLGVSHPRIKSKGFFSKIFASTMEVAREIPMQFCFFDFVTNHVYSQKMVESYGPATMSLFVGCQSKTTQANLQKLGIGDDPKESDRYSLLYSILPRVTYPFGKEIALPNSLGETFARFLKPLNLRWSPTSRFELLYREGEYQTHLQPTQSAVIFDLFDPGRQAVDKILREWHNLLKLGYQYAGINVPLDMRGVGNLQDILSESGFFVGGFIPFHNSDRLGFRFQAIGPTKLDFSEIQVYSESAKHLLAVIQDNYERVNG